VSPFERRIERGPDRRGLARASPPPGADTDRHGGRQDADHRQPPRNEPEALVRRRREDCIPILGDELVLDLGLRVPGGDAVRDHALDLLCGRRARLVERRVAHRTHDLSFEFGERRMLLARAGHRNEDQRRQHQQEEAFHDAAICRR
jgi:hypothetical protein